MTETIFGKSSFRCTLSFYNNLCYSSPPASDQEVLPLLLGVFLFCQKAISSSWFSPLERNTALIWRTSLIVNNKTISGKVGGGGRGSNCIKVAVPPERSSQHTPLLPEKLVRWIREKMMLTFFFRGFKWRLYREIADQHQYLFVVMLPLIDFLATYFSGTTAEGLYSIVKHSPPE